MAIADVDGDQQLEMLLADSSGTVACVNHDGTECWNRRLQGALKIRANPNLPEASFGVDACVGRELPPCLTVSYLTVTLNMHRA